MWKPIPSGTSAQIQDIWGSSNALVGGDVVLMAAAEKFQMGEKKIIRAKAGGVIDTMGWQAVDYRPIHSIWFDNNSSIFLCGTGVFSFDGRGWSEITEVPFCFTNRIRGNSGSDIIVVGDFGMVAHFNGSTWHNYPEVMLPAGQYNSVAIKGNTVIAVGIIAGSSKAAVLIARRR